MPEIMTRDFGPVVYSDDDVFDFALGMPGFRDCRQFLTVRPDPASPLIVLQSLERPEVAFLTLPVEALAIRYELRMIEEDRRLIGAARRGEWHVLLMLTLPAVGVPTLNLLGPVVLNPVTRRGVQAVRDDHRYSAVEPAEALLAAAERQECAPCS
jgi:flagellar assembly factor FliW